MKKILYSVALLAATMIGFTSCDEEDEKKVDVKEQAVGDYNVTVQYYLYDNSGKELESFGDASKGTGSVAISSDALKLNYDGDAYNLVKIAEASNGFTFDVEDLTATEDGKTYTLKGYNAYELKSNDGKSVKYNGGYISATKTLEFYMQLPNDQFSEMLENAIAEDEDMLNTFIQLAIIDEDLAEDLADEIEEIISKISMIVQITCVKK